jgi:hypothetical protein
LRRGAYPRSVEGVEGTDTLDEQLRTYVVELETPAAGWQTVQELAAKARAGAARPRRKRSSVSFVRAVFVPADGVCLLVYRGRSAREVRKVAASIDVPVRRVSTALNTTKGAQP